MYLLDTNVCIDFLLGSNKAVIGKLDAAFGRLAVSTITVAELRVGNRTSEDPKGDSERLNVFLANVDVVPFDDAAAIAYGETVRVAGIERKSFDRLIGAHAVALGMILITSNPKHFSGVPGLKLENWTL